MLAFIPGALVSVAYFVLAAWWAVVKNHAMWDDFFMVGVAWFMTSIGAALMLRVVWAAVAPERWLPRWLAIGLIVIVMGMALGTLLFVWYAGAWGP